MIASGSRLGPYDVVAKLGEGGMGEVWRATDTRLGRQVALKVLPHALADDGERHARFEREAKVLASFNHPNIATLYGLEHLDGQHVLVMELIDGEDLAERIGRGAIAPDEVIAIARQIAEALEAAHERGIVHRDLKPANVKVRPDGAVKVLDFGLAKAWESEAPAADLGNSPTVTSQYTRAGQVLGTAAYMSPEQARGGAVDGRADVWAFGAVLFEMLCGKRPFEGKTLPDVFAAVLGAEPPWNALPAQTPASVRALIARCLTRDPRRRLQAIGEARIALETPLGAAPQEPAAAPVRGRRGRRVLRLLLPAVGGAAIAIAGWSLLGRTAPQSPAPELIRLEISLPSDVEPVAGLAGAFALSPDGRMAAMIGVREGQRRLYLRRLDRREPVEVEASSGANAAAFSPDSSAIVFVPGSAQVVRLSLVDQQRAIVGTGADLGTTIAWGESGIYFLRGGALWMVPAAGGDERQLTHLDAARRDVLHFDPVELPGSRRVLFTTISGDGPRIEAVALDGGARSVVVERATSPILSATGHLLYERDGAVWAAALDPARGSITGAAVPVIRAGELGSLRFGSLGYRLSATGTLLYMPPEYDSKRVVSVARDGVERALELPLGTYANPRVSPDSKRLLIERSSSVTEVLELARGTRTQLAAPAYGTLFATWTRDGERVVSRRLNLPQWVAADGSGRSGVVPGGTVNDYPSGPGPDADSLLIVRIMPRTAGDILLVSVSGAFEPRALLATPAYEGGPQLSPDGRWLAYQSNASGQPEIYVRRYPALDRAWQLSESGGVQTRWSADGREIYYRTGKRMMAAAFNGSAAEPVLGRPVALFADEFDFGQGLSIANYDVTRDGRFVMLRRTPIGGRLHVVLNWSAELKRLIASGGVS